MEYIERTAAQIDAEERLADWRVLANTLQAEFRASSFPAAGELVARIAEAAEAANHHPDVDLRYPGRVRVVLTTHHTGGLTSLDADLARAISGLAAASGATPHPVVVQGVEMAIDTMDADRIRPFWAAVLGYRSAQGVLFDPARIGPPLWFQTMDTSRAERSRFHVDVIVPHDVAEERVRAALAAGGTLVTAAFARSWWVLADTDGNEACVCTWQDR